MDVYDYTTSNGGTGAKFKGYTTIIAGVASIVATVVSVLSIWLQAKNYRKPLLQRYVVRILLMVPIYSIASWTSMVSLKAAQFVDPVRDIYEAFTIYTFFQLLINYLGGERSLIVTTHGRAPVQHLWPLNHALPKVDISDPYTFLSIKRGILQYAWLKPILALAAVVMKATGTYQEGYIAVSSGYLWSGILYNISVSVSLYSLGLFWVCMHQDLKPFRPVPKFLSIKLIIFASYWQGFFLSILVWLGAIPDDVQGYTRDNLAAAIQDFLICIEMPIFAVVHWYAFSWYDFADNSILSARMPLSRALRDAFGTKDLVQDSKETFTGDKYKYRAFDSGDKVMAHAESSSRFARLDAGMRYERGGKGKYWLPKPGKTQQSPLLDNGEGGSADQESHRDGSMGTFDEPEIDADEERMYEQARQLEHGDWNYPVITANEPLSTRYGSSFSSRGAYSPVPRLSPPQRRSPASPAKPGTPKAQDSPQEPTVIAVKKKKTKSKKVVVHHPEPEAEALLPDADQGVQSSASHTRDGAASPPADDLQKDNVASGETEDENSAPKFDVQGSEEFRNALAQASTTGNKWLTIRWLSPHPYGSAPPEILGTPQAIMNYKFVLENRHETPTDGRSVKLEAPPPRDATPRKKQWTTRARTGCITCRARRVKCDETRPVCQRCTTSRVACRGYELPPPSADGGAHAAVSSVDIAAVRRQKQQKRGGVSAEIEPPSWDYLEGIRYYFEVVRPGRVSDKGTGFNDPPFHSSTWNRTAFLGQIVCDQLSKASKARGKLLKAGEDPAFEPSWARYSRNMVDAIETVNQKIRDEALYPNEAPAFMAIRHLLVLDLYLRRVLWRAHLRGTLAYIQHRGGIEEVLKLKQGPLYVNFAVENIIHANTTSPAKQQLEGLEDFTDEQLKGSLSNACFAPCPLELYPLMVHITRLRVSVAENRQPPRASLALKVQDMFNTTWHFDPDEWTESDSWHGEVEVGRVYGHVFPIAIRLYGILTLPASALIAWATSSAEIKFAYATLTGHSIVESLRTQHREELLALLRKNWDAVKYKPALVWPLLVAGVAVVDGAAEDRQFVGDCLDTILAMPITACSFITVVDKLRAFWRSGKTGWEDCWDEPTVGSA